MESQNFHDLVQYCREHYDYVLIDTPPLGSVIDSAIVAKECDGAIIVIEADAVSYRFVQNVKNQLAKSDVKILGTVLNKVPMGNGKYGYGKYGKYGYGKYGKYGEYGDYGAYGHDGGKGFASYLGMALALNWRAALVIFLAVVISTLVTDYVVIGTMTTVVSFPIYSALTGSCLTALLLSLVSLVIIYKHRMNLVRIRRGTEIGLRSANRGDHRANK